MSKVEEVKSTCGKRQDQGLFPDWSRQLWMKGDAAMDILQAMVDAMSVVGEKFSAGEIFVPEMLIAAKAMSNGVDVLKPLLAGGTLQVFRYPA